MQLRRLLIGVWAILLVALPSTLSAQQQTYDPTFCLGQTTYPIQSVTAAADLLTWTNCPGYYRSNQAYWQDGAMYKLSFDYQGRAYTYLFAEVDTLLEQIGQGLAQEANHLQLAVMPQDICLTYSSGQKLVVNALVGVYLRNDDLTLPQPRVGLHFLQEVEVVADAAGRTCQQSARPGEDYFVHVSNLRGTKTGWVGAYWTHPYPRYYESAENYPAAALRDPYIPTRTPWQYLAPSLTQVSQPQPATHCHPLHPAVEFEPAQVVIINSPTGGLELRAWNDLDTALTTLANQTQVAIVTSQPYCLETPFSGPGWQGSFQLWHYFVVTDSGLTGLVIAQSADGSQAYLLPTSR